MLYSPLMKTQHILFTLLLLLCLHTNLLASKQPNDKPDIQALEEQTQAYVNAMILFDYEVIALTDNGSIDLLGMHYLQQLNKWFYFGIGAHAPLLKGDYGGFMAFDVTFHAQKKIYDDLFINAGISLGGGGGGSSITQSKELSGTGGFIMSYVGLGYEFDNNVSLGINYANFKFINSQIDSSQVDIFVQVPLSYKVGLYSSAGSKVGSSYDFSKSKENIFTLELNNLLQIEPTASTKETISNITFQYSHFLDKNYYLFMELEVGYKGLPLYNQFTHGLGRKTSLSRTLNLYTQLGVGSGGYSPNNIDTGSGLLIYPKMSFEYLLNDNIGVALSGGYLYAPTGTSKNYTTGIALNYHLSHEKTKNYASSTTKSLRYKGFRFSIFPQTEFNVELNEEKYHDINMMTIQFDNLINDNFYFATQASIAYNDYQGYPGYGEALFGIGLQNKYLKSNKFQNFFQLLLGTNIHGIIFKPSIATNYSLSDRYALYAQFGYTMSVDNEHLYRQSQSMRAYNLGLGVTYRFSLY